MNLALKKSAEEIFVTANELEPQQQASFLLEVCAGNDALRREVDSLLDAASHSDEYFAGLAQRLGGTAILEADWQLPAGDNVGPYRLIRLLGRGGMGAVYLAERADEQFEKRVALKILPAGVSDANAASRFFAERQILARLVHPNIARLLDGGVTDEGAPYFVMDYVSGLPIDKYCDDHKLDIVKRLGLFCDVCAAVQYAHRNLVVHRDLKPGNVLVDDDGNVRLLDFGIAKILEPGFAETDATLLGKRPLTPAYASPEMIRGESVNTTSDVYSLGVLLYELLSGHLPYQIRGLPESEVVQAVCEQEPQPASAIAACTMQRDTQNESSVVRRTHEIAASRNINPQQLHNALRGDLDTILAKSLNKEPDQRYHSVEQFEQDIRRHFHGLPITARPPTLRYRGSRFVKRHKAAVAAAMMVAVSLLAVASLATRNAIKSAEQSRIIALERDNAEQIKDFLLGIFEVSGPNQAKGQTVSARELLDRGTERIREELLGQPETRAELMSTIAQIYAELSLFEKSRLLFEEAATLHSQTSGEASKGYGAAIGKLAVLAEKNGDYDEAESLAARAVSIWKVLDDQAGLAESLLVLGRIVHRKGDLDGGEVYYREALDIHRAIYGPRHEQVARNLSHLGTVVEHKGNLETAESMHRESLSIRRELFGNEHVDLIETLHNLASVLHNRGQNVEAIEHYEEALAISGKLMPEGSAGASFLLIGLGNVHRKMGDYDLAETRFRQAHQVLQRYFDADHPDTGIVLAHLGRLSMLKGDPKAAEPLLREGVAILERGAPNQQFLPDIRVTLGKSLMENGKFAEAEQVILKSYGQLSERLGLEHPRTKNAVVSLVELYEASGDSETAEKYRALSVE